MLLKFGSPQGMKILLLGGASLTTPGSVGSNNHDRSVGLIPTIRPDRQFLELAEEDRGYSSAPVYDASEVSFF